MHTTGIVCDSTSDIAPEDLAVMDVRMVPLTVRFGDDASLDWVEIQPAEFYERLVKFDGLPKTSQPSPAEFTAAYAELASAGVTEIVAITLSSKLSGTFESATIAAATSPVPVRVVDGLKASLGTGLIVKAAVAAREAGGSAEEIEQAAVHATAGVRILFLTDTLDYLVKGGRAGKAQAVAASLLNVKPVLEINAEGIIEPFRKVKGFGRGIDEMAAEVARESVLRGKMRVAILHSVRADLVERVVASLDAAGADYVLDMTGLIGAVIGTYMGPMTVGVAFLPME